jgi:hypothetical protein
MKCFEDIGKRQRFIYQSIMFQFSKQMSIHCTKYGDGQTVKT